MRVKAIEPVTYAGHDYGAGDEFDTDSELHGQLLLQRGSVVRADVKKPQGGRYRHRAMKADE